MTAPLSYGRVVVTAVLAAAGIWLLYKLEHVVFLLILAGFLAHLVAPLVRRAEQVARVAGAERGLPRGLAIAIVYVCMLAVASAGAWMLVPKVTQQLTDAVSQAPVYAASFRVWAQGWAGYYDRSNVPVEVRQALDRSVLGSGDAALAYARGSLMALAGALAYAPWLVLIPVLAFFLLKDARQLRRGAIALLPHRFRLRGRRLFDDLNATLAAYVRTQLLACVLVGGLCGSAFALLGVPYPAVLGLLAGVLEFIPLVGPFVCAVIATIVAAFHDPVRAVWVVGFLVSLRMVQDYLIYPRLVGRGLRLHPAAIIVAVLAGVELDGVAGMFLAVPAMAIASVVCRHWLEWRQGDFVVGRALPLSPDHVAARLSSSRHLTGVSRPS